MFKSESFGRRSQKPRCAREAKYVNTFGIVGVILSGIFASLPSMFIDLHWMCKRYEAKGNLFSSTRILPVSLIAATAAYSSIVSLQST